PITSTRGDSASTASNAAAADSKRQQPSAPQERAGLCSGRASDGDATDGEATDDARDADAPAGDAPDGDGPDGTATDGDALANPAPVGLASSDRTGAPSGGVAWRSPAVGVQPDRTSVG